MKFRVLDFETTGFPPAASVCEIGFTDVEWFADPRAGDTVIHPTSSMIVKPLHMIELEAMAIHHITEADVQDKPSCTVALNSLIKHAHLKGVDVWVAHNNEFELKFFNPPDSKWICTYKSSVVIWPNAPKHTNQVLRYFLNLPCESELAEPAHRAGPDTYVTALLLLEALKHKTPEELMTITTQPRQARVLTSVDFGKHKGKQWSEVPRDYMQWLLGQDKFQIQPDVKATCEHYLGIKPVQKSPV